MTVLLVAILLAPPTGAREEIRLESLPEECGPVEIGNRLVYRFLRTERMKLPYRYAEVCTWSGALKFAHASGNQDFLAKLEERFVPVFSTDKDAIPPIGFYRDDFKHYVDFNVFGVLPLTLYQITRNDNYKALGLSYADAQWTLPEGATPGHKAYLEQGLTWQTRFWIDDMYMITALQSEAYRATGDRKYVERAAKEMIAYLDALQRPDGLFYHAPDAPFYWARGNGWVAVGMTELLRNLPADSPCRPRILASYTKMMECLKKYQRTDGLWGQLIDKADIWVETSGSAMFVHAMITGITHGWLDKSRYEDGAVEGWMALIKHLDAEGNMTEVCVGTGKRNDEQFYYDRPRKTGDYHGQVPMLWCACALLEYVNR
ncbi:glycoside hydrolase family 88 protein [Termitidicoccus mucosus]